MQKEFRPRRKGPAFKNTLDFLAGRVEAGLSQLCVLGLPAVGFGGLNISRHVTRMPEARAWVAE